MGRYRWRMEAGQVFALFALALPVLLGMSALVIDVGTLFVEKRSMQQAADAAALAAVQRLPDGPCNDVCRAGLPAVHGMPAVPGVATLAGTYSGRNLGGSGGALPPCAGSVTSNCYELLDAFNTCDIAETCVRVRVRLTKSVSTLFGGLIGKSSYAVGARAVAARLHTFAPPNPGAPPSTPTVFNLDE